ncbi:hypothetical protein D0Z00_003096 [Geotrichum galactomycetum]|uniref:Uncharacterized protein n=1 Tax=Geotrichum galactomycetum TaxID=27317 RepID=A0ACB6V2A2_9ASCO|nr:hypothetical protein D0Z00_003096 [Geotrichum candidum]
MSDMKVQSRALALKVNADGEINYDAIAKRGHSSTRNVQTSFQDLVPLRQRAHQSGSEVSLEKPSQEEIATTTQKTQLAIQKILDAKLGANKPKTIANKKSEATYVRYTPTSRLGETGSHEQRIIKMVDLPEDPLAPPKFKHKKVPGRPPSPPAPVLRSPPRKLTAQDQEAWYIPPSVSNWKNPKGFTIALDKRVAADGRRLEKVEINDNFAKLSEALAVADRKAREEIGQRANMQQKLAERENAAKEERLRELAQQAREERERSVVGRPPRRDSRSPDRSRNRSHSPSDRRRSFSDNSEDERDRRSYYSDSENEAETAEERKRREYREDKRREAERELRRSRMGQERRARDLARDRDISEKVALGVAQPTKPANASEAQFDSRLFGTISSSIGSGYNEDQVYDKSLFAAREAVQSIYRARGGAAGSNTYSEEDGQSELDKLSRENRFDTLGRAPKSFEGAGEARDGPVEFEKDTTGGFAAKTDEDPFGVGQMINEVQQSKKYGLEKPNARGSSPSGSERDSKRSRNN